MTPRDAQECLNWVEGHSHYPSWTEEGEWFWDNDVRVSGFYRSGTFNGLAESTFVLVFRDPGSPQEWRLRINGENGTMRYGSAIEAKIQAWRVLDQRRRLQD